jgi:hypothetical protein
MATIQEAIAGLEFGLTIEDDEIVSDALVILRITRMTDGRNTVGFTKSDGADVVIVSGLLECARQIDAGAWNDVDAE